MKGVKKQDLPEKICIVCGRPFVWRKKWQENWAEVKYCSNACRRNRRTIVIEESAGKKNPYGL